MADPECREVANASYAQLQRIELEAEEVQRERQANTVQANKQSLLKVLLEVRGEA